MSLAVLTPFTRAAASKSGQRTWRKRLLPVGDVHYQGRTLHFDREYLSGLVRAFNAKAYDQVPFQLAGADNKHTNDVERYAGQIVSLDLADDGLYAVAEVTERGNRLLEANPGLGVSARIVEGYDRSDGKHFPAAVQHVLATLDPRIPGLGGWQAVEAANDVQITIDMSATHFEGDDAPWPARGDSLRQEALATLGLPADATQQEISALMSALLEADEEDQALAAWAEGLDMREVLGAGGSSYKPPDSTQLATLAGIQRSVELSNALDELRVIEDAEPLPRLAEDRLAHLLDRVSRGSYTPQPQPGYAPQHPSYPGHPGPVTALPNCGPSDPVGGYCMSRYHTAHCGSLATTEMAEAAREPLRSSAYQPLVNQQTGQPYIDQHGEPVTLAGAVEASMGERLTRESAFEGHPRRELIAIQRQAVLGDPDDPSGDVPMPDATRRTAAQLASRLGLAGPGKRAERERARAQRDRVLAARQLAAGGRVHPDYGESPQERAARLSRTGTGTLVKVADGVSGSLPVYRPAGL